MRTTRRSQRHRCKRSRHEHVTDRRNKTRRSYFRHRNRHETHQSHLMNRHRSFSKDRNRSFSRDRRYERNRSIQKWRRNGELCESMAAFLKSGERKRCPHGKTCEFRHEFNETELASLSSKMTQNNNAKMHYTLGFAKLFRDQNVELIRQADVNGMSIHSAARMVHRLFMK